MKPKKFFKCVENTKVVLKVAENASNLVSREVSIRVFISAKVSNSCGLCAGISRKKPP